MRCIFELISEFTKLGTEENKMNHFENAVELAEKMWDEGILDEQVLPNGKFYKGDTRRIEKIVQDGGGDFWFNWMIKKFGRYRDRKVEWCGFFVGACFPTLAPSIRLELISSCNRIDNDWDQTEFSKPAYIDPKDIQPGDVVTKNGDRLNSHMMLAISTVERGVFRTIEGNAYGQSPSGVRVEGVVKNQRFTKDVYAVYRFTKEMLNG